MLWRWHRRQYFGKDYVPERRGIKKYAYNFYKYIVNKVRQLIFGLLNFIYSSFKNIVKSRLFKLVCIVLFGMVIFSFFYNDYDIPEKSIHVRMGLDRISPDYDPLLIALQSSHYNVEFNFHDEGSNPQHRYWEFTLFTECRFYHSYQTQIHIYNVIQEYNKWGEKFFNDPVRYEKLSPQFQYSLRKFYSNSFMRSFIFLNNVENNMNEAIFYAADIVDWFGAPDAHRILYQEIQHDRINCYQIISANKSNYYTEWTSQYLETRN